MTTIQLTLSADDIEALKQALNETKDPNFVSIVEHIFEQVKLIEGV